MDFVLFYTVPYNNTQFYALRIDGHLFNFNLTTFAFTDVTAEESLDYGWDMVEEDEFYEKILEAYEEFSMFLYDTTVKQDKKGLFTDIVFGSNFTYYQKNNKIRCSDENYNEYDCDKIHMFLSKSSVIDKSWSEVTRKDVIKKLLGFDPVVNLNDCELYLDSNKDIRVFNEEGDQYRVSSITGDINLVSVNDGIKDEWESVDMTYIDNIDTSVQVSLFGYDVPLLINKHKYFDEQRVLLKEQGIEIGNDFFFFSDNYGYIYAKDEKGCEYKVTPSSLIPLDSGTIKDDFSYVNHLDALPLACFKEKRENILKNGGKVSLFDLNYGINSDSYIYGYMENGDCYYLDDYGEFTKAYEKDKEKLTKDFKEVNEIKVLTFQARVRNENELSTYCYEAGNVLKMMGVQLGKEYNFFESFKDETYGVYLVDDKDQVFFCNINYLSPLNKSDVDMKSFIPLPLNKVMIAIKLCHEVTTRDFEKTEVTDEEIEEALKLPDDFIEHLEE